MVVGYGVVNAFVWLLDQSLSPTLMIVSAYIFVEEPFSGFSAFFIGQKRPMYRLIISADLKLLTWAGGTAAYLKRTLAPILLTYLVLDIVLVITAYVVVRRDSGPIRLSMDWRRGLSLMRISLPFFAFNELTIVHLRLDTFTVGIVLSLVQVAYYDLAMKLLEVARLVIRPPYAVSYPILAEMAMQCQLRVFRRRTLRLVGAALGLGLIVTLAMATLAPQLIVLLFGANYAASILPTSIVSLSVPLIYVHFVLTAVANALRMENQSAWFLGLSAAMNLGLHNFVIPRYGIIGAAWTTLISQSLLTGSLCGSRALNCSA
jgi:O-antigen/teichoic acid export membrane protein